MLRDDGLAVAAQLGARGVALTVLTNSLHSTNAYYTAARPQTGTFPGSQRWGVHSKRAAIDDDTIMIGTDNVDPRSANRNSGLMVVCQGSPALAAPMNADLHERIRKLPHLSDRRQVELSGLF